MTQGKRTDERPSPELVSIVLERFGVSIDEASRGWEGEESVGWRGSSRNEERFVQRLASWRDIGDLMWSDSVARVASTTAPEVIHAIPSHDGATAVLTPEGPVMVFPFIEGSHDGQVGIARDAAELLGRIPAGSPPRGTRSMRDGERVTSWVVLMTCSLTKSWTTGSGLQLLPPIYRSTVTTTGATS